MPPRALTTPRKSARTINGRATRDLRILLGNEIRRQRLDAGLSIRQVATEAGIDDGFLSLIERGLREPSLAVLTTIARALGGDLRVRIYPGTGPRLRDPIQAAIVEALLREIHARWQRDLEVPVYRPARGVIDLVLHEPSPAVIVASEIQSELRRLEQLLRWSHEKADSLRSATMWRFGADLAAPRIDRLLVVRSTLANRRTVSAVAETLRTEFPGSTADAYRALTTPGAPWPGSAILWASVERGAARILDGPPRGLAT